MRHRKRGPKSRWLWADSSSQSLQQDGKDDQQAIVVELLPAPRVRYVLDTSQRDSLVVDTILLWLRFAVGNTGSAPENMATNGFDFYVIRTNSDIVGETQDYLPYAEPTLPTTLTAWTDSVLPSEPEGTDPFLWTHKLFCPATNGGLPSSVIGAASVNPPFGYVAASNIWAWPDPAQSIAQAWQPNVVVKTKRKLMRNDALALGVTWFSPTGNTGIYYNLQWATRILGHVR